ncbi:MAG: hypothetical protein R3E32_17285 [Chitinophagales bacterium]
MNALGFWKEFYFRGDNLPSIFENGVLTKKGEQDEKIHPKIIAYLKSGIWLFKARSLFICLLTEEVIGTPYTYTDGKWYWTTEYIYYLENYNLSIPTDFLEWIELNNYEIPKEEDFEKERIESLKEEIEDYGF